MLSESEVVAITERTTPNETFETHKQGNPKLARATIRSKPDVKYRIVDKLVEKLQRRSHRANEEGEEFIKNVTVDTLSNSLLYPN